VTIATVASEKYLTVPEIAAQLGMKPAGVQHWLATGKLRGYQPGGRRMGWRVRERDLAAFLEASANRPADETEE
jgi:excisionase family DNA binding protein